MSVQLYVFVLTGLVRTCKWYSFLLVCMLTGRRGKYKENMCVSVSTIHTYWYVLTGTGEHVSTIGMNRYRLY